MDYTSNIDNYSSVDNVRNFVARLLKVENLPDKIAVDTETHFDEGAYHKGAIIKFIKGTPNNMPFGVSLYHWGKGYWVDKDLLDLDPLLKNEKIVKILHNAKYDMFMFQNLGTELRGRILDTMIMMQLIDEEHVCKLPDGTEKKSKRLADLTYHFLGRDIYELENLVDKARKEIASERGVHKNAVSYKDVGDKYPILMRDYAVADTHACYDLCHELIPKMDEQDLWNAYDTDIAATATVVEIERRGVKVDKERIKEDEGKLADVVSEVKADIYTTAGKEFNVDSDRELVEVYKDMGLEWEWFTDKEEYNTDKTVLKRLAKNHEGPIAALSELVMEYRKASKILSTYVKGIQPYIQRGDRVHCDYFVNPDDYGAGGTATGRLSSSNPNLQNLPKKPIKIRDVEINVRGYFIPDEGHIMVFKDADQEEYRVLAHYGNDRHFIDMCNKGYDIHKGAYAMLHDIPYEEVTDEQRSEGKTNNFAIVYGLGNLAFANSLGFDIDEKLVRRATVGVLYNHFKPWELPPYSKISKEQILRALPPEHQKDEEFLEALDYFLNDEVQEGIRTAREKKKAYFDKFRGIKSFIDECTKRARQRGYVMTWTGRRRHFPDPKFAYKAPNAVIQGGCGDVIKVKMHEVAQFLKPYKSFLILTTHDELGFNIHEDELDLLPEIDRILEDLPFRVPITWGTEWSESSWGEKKEEPLPTLCKEGVVV